MNEPIITTCQAGLDWLYEQYWTEHYEEPSEARSSTNQLDKKLLCTALSFIPADDYSLWIIIGMALKAAGLELAIWEEWSKKSAEYKPGVCTEKWKTFKPTKVGLGTIFHYAKLNGFRFSSTAQTGTDQNTKSVRPSISIIRATDLMRLQLPEPRWAIEPVLPEGLTVLAGAPKVGKSWLAIAIVHAIASGSTVLGFPKTMPGEALYFALEDNHRRLKERLGKFCGDTSIPSNLMFSCAIPRCDEDGLLALEKVLEEHPQCRLVIIDTLGRFNPAPSTHMTAYDNDYRALANMQSLAMSKHIALVVITHLRKMKSTDPLEEITGSTGITGAADAIWLLKRPRGDVNGTLSITGRDVEERTLAVQFDKSSCQWNALGDAAQYQLGKERLQIYDFLKAIGRPVGPTEVAKTLGQREGNTKNLMWKMHLDGQLGKSGRGQYFIPALIDDLDDDAA